MGSVLCYWLRSVNPTHCGKRRSELMCGTDPAAQSQGASSYILDLRSNPGGLVQAGMDIARLWLDGHPTIVSITGRSDMPQQQVRVHSMPG